MTTNQHPTTGIAYGIIACNSLDPDVLHELLYVKGKDLSYDEACKEEEARQRAEFDEAVTTIQQYVSTAIAQELREEFEPNLDSFEPMIDEPIIEGECGGVSYRTTWLGGAQLLWVFESPRIANFLVCSPCVPGAADLDNPRDLGDMAGSVLGYDVPPGWRFKEPS
jgi:hypothetical protein